jgi:hypothetical protein
MSDDKLYVSVENAPKMQEWLATRGGLLRWHSQDLANPAGSWTTPATDAAGNRPGPPHWSAGDPELITDPKQVLVEVKVEEARRFHVALKRGSGLLITLTDGSHNRVMKALARARRSGRYVDVGYGFDYSTQEAVITGVVATVPIDEWTPEATQDTTPTTAGGGG